MTNYASINESIRLSVTTKVSPETRSALAAFCCRNGFPHIFFEILEPLLSGADLVLALASTDRPWPPKGIGSQTIDAVGIAMIGSEGRGLLTPVLIDRSHSTNLGLAGAVTKQLLETLRDRKASSAAYLVREGDRVLERALESKAIVLACQEYGDDYIGQQVTKLSADLFTNAALIAHIDSDCIFREPCSLPALLTKNGRPIIRILGRSRRRAGDGWRRTVADFHGEPLPFDALVPPPIVYPPSLYRDLRAQCQDRHGVALDQWVLSRSIDAVSEFGLMAGQAWFERRDDFCWVSVDDEVGWPCIQYWSRSPKAADMQAELSRVLGSQS